MTSFSSALRRDDAFVTLTVNDSEIALTSQEYEGKSVRQLFEQYGGRLGTDISRITSYTVAGLSVDGDSTVVPGAAVRGNVTSDSKR
jgi:hypothetical protein